MNYWQSRNKEITDIVNPQKQIKKMYRDSYKRQREYINTLYDSLKSGNTLTRTELYQFSQFLKIKREIKKECNTNLARLTKEVESTLKKAYKETFGNTRYLGKKGSKKEWTVENIKRMESCLETAWSGEHFSKRLYKNTNKLARTIEEVIVDSVVNGKSKQECIRAIRERNDISYRQAETLWQTETSYVINKADLDTFQSDGCEEVEIMAELRERTCEHCRSKDGKKVKIKGAKIGVDIPPFHPRCHCDILPVVNWKSSENNTSSKVENAKNNLTNQSDSGIMSMKGKEVMDTVIDKFTPCLEDARTGKILSTRYSIVAEKDLDNVVDWKFDWRGYDLKNSSIYKLMLDGDEIIQGLVALTKYTRDRAIYVNIAEASPHNIGKDKLYNGVGGHLFAIAVQQSIEAGYGGFVFMDAKNLELVEHYRKTLGATLLGRPHPYRMFIDEENAKKLLEIYNFGKEK